MDAARAVVQSVISALASCDWMGAAQLVDDDDVREWYHTFLAVPEEPMPEVTARDIQRGLPKMPDVVAEYHASEVMRRREESRGSLSGLFAGLSTRHELALTDPLEALGQYLQAQDPNWLYEQHLRRIGRAAIKDPSPIPVRLRTMVGAVMESPDIAHVLYRVSWRGEVGEWSDGDICVATLRQTAEGWRLRLRGELFEHSNIGFETEPDDGDQVRIPNTEQRTDGA